MFMSRRLGSIRRRGGLPPVAEIAQPVEVIPQKVAVTRRKTIVVRHALHRPNHVAQRAAVPLARGVISLQIVKLPVYRGEAVTVVAAEGLARYVVEVLANASEQAGAPVAVLEIVAFAVEVVIVAIAVFIAFGRRRRRRAVTAHQSGNIECVPFGRRCGLRPARRPEEREPKSAAPAHPRRRNGILGDLEA